MGLSLVGGGEERYERRRLKKASRTKAVDAVVSFDLVRRAETDLRNSLDQAESRELPRTRSTRRTTRSHWVEKGQLSLLRGR